MKLFLPVSVFAYPEIHTEGLEVILSGEFV